MSSKSASNPIRQYWLDASTSQALIDGFPSFLHTRDKDLKQGYKNLALYAAVPVFLTPELLELIRSNFLPGLPWFAGSQFLLSPLCKASQKK